MNSKDPIVYIIDDNVSIRNSLCMLMKSVCLNALSYDSANSFIEKYDNKLYGCVLLDIRMPGKNGLDLQRMLLERKSYLPVIIITGHADVPMAIRAMKAGAYDFFEKPFNEQRLLETIYECLDRGKNIYSKRRAYEKKLVCLGNLSKREHQIMHLIAEGYSSRLIASQLYISPKTVDVHRAHIFEKLNVNNIVELVHFATDILPQQ